MEEILKLEDMQHRSIDEIVELYNQGYRLELGYGLKSENRLETKSLDYTSDCTGSSTLDFNRALVQQGGVMLYQGNAIACSFVPTSRCLDLITFNKIKRYGTSGFRFEIRENNATSNSPMGTPSSSTGLITSVAVPAGNISNITFTDTTVDFSVILPSANTTYWIVIYSNDYGSVCSNNTGSGFERLEMSFADVTNSARRVYGLSDVYCTGGGCCWYTVGTNDSWSFALYNKSYSSGTTSSGTTSSGTTSSGTTSGGGDGGGKGSSNSAVWMGGIVVLGLAVYYMTRPKVKTK